MKYYFIHIESLIESDELDVKTSSMEKYSSVEESLKRKGSDITILNHKALSARNFRLINWNFCEYKYCFLIETNSDSDYIKYMKENSLDMEYFVDLDSAKLKYELL